MTIVFNTDTIRLLTLFENMVNVPVIDCFRNKDVIYFIVEEGKIGLAIGKNGTAIKRAERIIGKRIKVFEYSKNPVQFIKNLIPQSKEIRIVNERDGVSVVVKVDRRDRGYVIGRGSEKLNIYKQILQRNHEIINIQVK